MIDELQRDDSRCCFLDRLSQFRVEHTGVGVDGGGGALEVAPCADEGGRHAIPGLVDGEVDEGALRLSAPVLVGRHFDGAEGVRLCTGLAGVSWLIYLVLVGILCRLLVPC